MSCTQQKQLVSFPKVRIQKHWFRFFFDHKEYKNDGNVHLFGLMALFSYANFRTNKRRIGSAVFTEAPGQWCCRLSSLPRIMRVHSKQKAQELLDYYTELGLLKYEYINPGTDWLRHEIVDWKRHCIHLDYNYYSYKGSGFFFFPLPVGRTLLHKAQSSGGQQFSELDAIMDLWLHTVLNDETVKGSEFMPVVYYANLHGVPLMSYSYLAKRWGWSKSRVGRFILKIEEGGLIGRVSFSSSRGSVISPCGYREMIFGADCQQIELQRIGEILGLVSLVDVEGSDQALDLQVETCVPSGEIDAKSSEAIRIAVFRRKRSSFFARPVPLIFYSSRGRSKCRREGEADRGPPQNQKP